MIQPDNVMDFIDDLRINLLNAVQSIKISEQ